MGPMSSDGDFEAFVASRGPRLLRVAWLLTGDAHLAEDLLQTVLAKVWPKWERIGRDHPEAYIRAALVNTHNSWWRRRWRGEVPHGEFPPETLRTRSADPYDPFASVELEMVLATAIRALPARQRAVVVLRYFEDLSVEETAATLGCTQGTVKSQSSKALRTLRGLLPPPTAEGTGDRRALLAL
ncbi:SigE family RNA polymerase sigma factor [Streptomyces sp. NPDC093249]|uniref:SigE family RNA polymerase sigma factor n=2 Tax=Streptomyces TaxID=1883 RepID=UPI0038301531